MKRLSWAIIGLLLVTSGCETARTVSGRSQYLIGYTDLGCDDPRGQFYNSRTARAMIVRADGTGRREIGASLITRSNSWTQFAGFWPDGRRAVISSAWESEDNYLWEREHKKFRRNDGWLVDGCLVDIRTDHAVN